MLGLFNEKLSAKLFGLCALLSSRGELLMMAETMTIPLPAMDTFCAAFGVFDSHAPSATRM